MRSCFASKFIEPLERRQLFAATVSGLFSGSVLINDQQHHVVVNVTDAADSGLVSGTFRIDDLGRYTFSGSATNDVLSLIFNGARGGGSLVAKIDDGLSGTLSGTIDGAATSGTARLRGSSASQTTGTAAVLIDSADITNTTSGIDATLGGTVQFRGEGAATLERRRVHAVVHVDDTSTSGLFTGSFRMDRVGRFRFNGSVGPDGVATIVFAGGAGSGTIVADVGDALASLKSGSLAGLDNLSGKIFATIGGTDVHGIIRLNLSGAANASGLTVGGQAIVTPPVELPGNGTNLGGTTSGSSFGAIDTGTDIGDIMNPISMTGTGETPTGVGTTIGSLFGNTPIGAGMFS
jgi:VCBS repeat-containing protein